MHHPETSPHGAATATVVHDQSCKASMQVFVRAYRDAGDGEPACIHDHSAASVGASTAQCCERSPVAACGMAVAAFTRVESSRDTRSRSTLLPWRDVPERPEERANPTRNVFRTLTCFLPLTRSRPLPVPVDHCWPRACCSRQGGGGGGDMSAIAEAVRSGPVASSAPTPSLRTALTAGPRQPRRERGCADTVHLFSVAPARLYSRRVTIAIGHPVWASQVHSPGNSADSSDFLHGARCGAAPP